jgi:hypothetical protein
LSKPSLFRRSHHERLSISETSAVVAGERIQVCVRRTQFGVGRLDRVVWRRKRERASADRFDCFAAGWERGCAKPVEAAPAGSISDDAGPAAAVGPRLCSPGPVAADAWANA